MLSFKSFLTEQEDPEEGASRQIKHLTHVEDRPLQTGEKGTAHAIKSLTAAAEHIKAGKKSSELTTKYDGSPALVYGHHPTTGKFFVASKSAFNKTPKINYTPKDIDKNHGHAPGLAAKLKDALTHLSKTTPKQGVYQGDMMFGTDKSDKQPEKGGGHSFHPNPSGLTYTAHGQHDPRMDTAKVHFSPEEQKKFNKHIAMAQSVHDTHGDDMYDGTKAHHGVGGPLETYMNHTVRTGEEPNHQNFKNWLETDTNKKIDKLKVEKNRTAKQADLKAELGKIEKNKKHYNNVFKMHGHIQKAKDTLIGVMNQHQEFQHTHGGESANPEGYVFHHDKESDKFVNRAEFSKRNFAGIRNI